MAELLHGQVALRLRQLPVQGLGVVAVLYEFVGHFLRFKAGAAEYYGINARVIVHNPLECGIFVAGMHEIVLVVHLFGPFVARADYDFLGVGEVIACNLLDFLTHGGREEKRVAVAGNAFEYAVDTFRKTHVEHFVGLVENHIVYIVERGSPALHQVDEPPGRGHYNLHAAPQGAYLARDVGAAVNGKHAHTVEVFGIVFQVAGYLQAQFARGTEHHGLHAFPRRVYLLQQRKPVGRRLACSGLRKGYHVVSLTQKVWNYCLLNRHWRFVAYFVYRPDKVRHQAEFFKSLQCLISLCVLAAKVTIFSSPAP